jgi:predicted metal-binding membrane protein
VTLLLTILRHERSLAIAALLAVIGLSWAWLLVGAGLGMEQMDMGGGQIMAMAPAWTPSYAALVFVMWVVMMAAMMLPAATPTILLIDALARQKAKGSQATGLFTLGYLAVWAGFSAFTTGLQWGLVRVALLGHDMASASPVFVGVLLIAAGIYQWTPLKQACLNHCRAPFDFLIRHWGRGPLRAGVDHGLYCLGCCWVLMVLLFAFGLMNLLWIAALSLLVLIEKVLPMGGRMSHVTGAALLAWGVGVLALESFMRQG